MPINLTCEQCGKAGSVPDQMAGQRVVCPRCKSMLIAPGMPANTDNMAARFLLGGPAPTEIAPMAEIVEDTPGPVIQFICPTCQQKMQMPREAAGAKIFCEHCNQKLEVPRPPANKTVLGIISAEVVGQESPPTEKPAKPKKKKRRRDPLRTIATRLILSGSIGLAAGLWFFWSYLWMDTTVPVPDYSFGFQQVTRVHNIGLLNQKQTGLVVSGLGAALGFIVFVAGQICGAMARRNPIRPKDQEAA